MNIQLRKPKNKSQKFKKWFVELINLRQLLQILKHQKKDNFHTCTGIVWLRN
ncbi:unnamed protein product [Paramecium octaurelia]|uniref:Uncharacterized protein n=1 Tax=Paramecium octaurelia TaxID=43137 RepID=A0A8S1UV57_PAROT|nr:unnamed protein product [Paramecium octaurelia]